MKIPFLRPYKISMKVFLIFMLKKIYYAQKTKIDYDFSAKNPNHPVITSRNFSLRSFTFDLKLDKILTESNKRMDKKCVNILILLSCEFNLTHNIKGDIN
ncbi:hypothetical protein BpHYR1_037044 [Brachionus plicatilis]|uniref:Uncharacterized protein n=1 Tax=Brachionus plicatilis TaxID=10195 RepID=A0A3M7SMU5_BRAPC|nr:hypothetical protein BpHYR1_037044 [Brachionus plicatilis]